MSARVLTDVEWDRHFRIGAALGVDPEALNAEPRDKQIHAHAVTELEPCEVCGVRVFAVEEDDVISVVEPIGSPEYRSADGEFSAGWWHDFVTHCCRRGSEHPAWVERVEAAL